MTASYSYICRCIARQGGGRWVAIDHDMHTEWRHPDAGCVIVVRRARRGVVAARVHCLTEDMTVSTALGSWEDATRWLRRHCPAWRETRGAHMRARR